MEHVTFLLLALLTAAPDRVAEARKHAEAGRALYSVERFADAVIEFEAGYALVPKPLFLFNAAQSLRKLAENTQDLGTMLRAQARYQEYLRIAPAQDPERAQSESTLASIELWLQAHPAPSQDAPRAATLVPPVATVAVAAIPVAPPPEVAQSKSILSQPWFWVVASVVVVGASVGTALGVRQAQGGCAVATIGCLDAR